MRAMLRNVVFPFLHSHRNRARGTGFEDLLFVHDGNFQGVFLLCVSYRRIVVWFGFVVFYAVSSFTAIDTQELLLSEVIKEC